MAWNDPNEVEWEVGDILTSDSLKDYVRDNLLALKDPPSAEVVLDESSNYTIAALTDWTNIDGTVLSLEITTQGGDVMVHFDGYFGGSPAVHLDFTLNGTRYGGDSGLIRGTGAVSFTRLLTGLAAGIYTLTLQWKNTASSNTVTLYAGAGTTDLDLHPQFWAREVS